MSDLINGDAFSALKVYYRKVGDFDSIAWGVVFCVEKLKSGGWGGGRQEIVGKLSLGDVCTTGLPKEDADRYYSS